MENELFKELDQIKHSSSTRLPRTSKPVPPRIDLECGPEEYQRLLDAKDKSDSKIAGILAAREAAKAIQKEINYLRSERAKIKGQSKASKSKRHEFDIKIDILRATKAAT